MTSRVVSLPEALEVGMILAAPQPHVAPRIAH